MKKLLAVILAIAMLLPAAALADLPDISGLTAEELIELSRQIQLRLFSEQLVNGVEVPPGKYYVGEDIPAGNYRIEITGGTGSFDLKDQKDGKLILTGVTGQFYKITEIGKLILEEGNELTIYNSTFVFYPYVGFFN